MGNPVTVKFTDLLLAFGYHAGLQWEVSSNGIGYRCGYVRVMPGHPWHGKDYDAVAPNPSVHGGLTYCSPDTDGADHGWWLGFDCAHDGDLPDPSLPTHRDIPPWFSPWPDYYTIKTTEYVEMQCRSLAEQAAAAVDDQATALLITQVMG